MGSTPIHAQSGSATSSAIPSNAAPSIGEQIEVTISLDVTDVDAPDDALGSYTCSLNWDPAVLAYDSYTGAPPAGFAGVVNVSQASSGRIVFSGANASGTRGKITLLNITFDVVGAGSSDLDLEYSAMAAAYTFEDLLPLLTVYDGHVQVGLAQHYSLTIAVEPAEAGATDPELGVHTYPEGTVVNIAALPETTYEFDHWGGACAGRGTCQVIVNADKAVTAYFTELPPRCYTLTLSHAGQGSDPVADPTNSTGCSSGSYVEGQWIDLSGATPDAGWQISGWTGTSQDNSTADTNSLTMPAGARAAGVVYEVSTYPSAVSGGVATSEPEPTEAAIEESEATATSCLNPGTEVSDSSSPGMSTQQVAREQDLAIDPEYSERSDLTHGTDDSLSHGTDGSLSHGTRDSLTFSVLRVIQQVSCVLAIFLGLVVSALLVIRYRFVSSE
jgi:hypothetical protein